MEGDVFALETIFSYKYLGQNMDGSLRGTFVPSRIRPRFLARLEYFGLADAFMDAISDQERTAE